MTPLDPTHDVGGATLIHARRGDDHTEPHSHDAVMLFLPLRGRVYFDVGDVRLRCTPQQALCVMDGVIHAHAAEDPVVEYLVAYLSPSTFRAHARLTDTAPPAWTFAQTVLLREAAAQLCAEAERVDPQADAIAEACVQLLSAAAARGLNHDAARHSPRRPAPDDPRLARALEHARQHCCLFPSVDDLARVAGMSRRSLERAFKKHLGTSPRQALEDLRLHEAHRRITTTDDSITEIAFAVGYKDLSHFIRAFQRLYHHSPTALRTPQLRAARHHDTSKR